MHSLQYSKGQRFKRAKRDGRLCFSFNWRGTYKTAFAARNYTQADVAREEAREELISVNPVQARRRGYFF